MIKNSLIILCLIFSVSLFAQKKGNRKGNRKGSAQFYICSCCKCNYFIITYNDSTWWDIGGVTDSTRIAFFGLGYDIDSTGCRLYRPIIPNEPFTYKYSMLGVGGFLPSNKIVVYGLNKDSLLLKR